MLRARILGFVTALAAVLVLGVSGTFAGTPISHTDTGLDLELPDGWTGRGGDVLSVKNDEETAFIYFWGSDYSDPEAAAKNIEAELASFLEGVKRKGKVEKTDVNGRAAANAKGTAKIGDFSVVWNATVIKAEKERVAIVLGFADKDTWKTEKANFDAVVSSVKLGAE